MLLLLVVDGPVSVVVDVLFAVVLVVEVVLVVPIVVGAVVALLLSVPSVPHPMSRNDSTRIGASRVGISTTEME